VLPNGKPVPYGIILDRASKKKIGKLDADSEGRSMMLACLDPLADPDDPQAPFTYMWRLMPA
jgi:hypothetical protein